MVSTYKQIHRPMEQNRKPSNKLMHIHQLIFNKDTRDTKWGKDSLFNEWCWENSISTCKRMKLNPCHTPYIKMNSKWIIDVNLRPDTITLLEENIGETTLSHESWQRFFWNMIPKLRATKAKIHKWD